jgi:sugar phosphate isomerase/epimerase
MIKGNVARMIDLQIGIEVYINNETASRMDRSDARDIGRELAERGIFCTAHAPYMDLSPGGVDREIRAASLEKLKKAVEIARLIGARGIVCHGGYDRWRFGGHEGLWLENSVKTWTEVLKESGDLPVFIENIFEENPSTIVELLAVFKDKNMWYCFDTGHFNLFSTIPVDEWLRPLKDRLREFHIHDNHGKSDEHLPVGRGTFPFKELKQFIRHLNGVFFTAETGSEASAVETIKCAKEFLS